MGPSEYEMTSSVYVRAITVHSIHYQERRVWTKAEALMMGDLLLKLPLEGKRKCYKMI